MISINSTNKTEGLKEIYAKMLAYRKLRNKRAFAIILQTN